MQGDLADMKARLLSVMPARWFGLVGVSLTNSDLASAAPVLNGLLSGLASGLASIFQLFSEVRLQARIATATGEFLDMISTDYFGQGLPRRATEGDGAFRSRIRANLLQPRGTRRDVVNTLVILTGRVPTIFEPSRTADTGGYGTTLGVANGFAFGAAGGWGSLEMPFEFFVTAFRPHGEGIAQLGGYGTAGPFAYANLSMVVATVTDSEIYGAVAETIPAASRAWVCIKG